MFPTVSTVRRFDVSYSKYSNVEVRLMFPTVSTVM